MVTAVNREGPAHALTDCPARRIEALDTNALEDHFVFAGVRETVRHFMFRHGTPFRIVASRLITRELPEDS
jgi:hypothetical protein